MLFNLYILYLPLSDDSIGFSTPPLFRATGELRTTQPLNLCYSLCCLIALQFYYCTSTIQWFSMSNATSTGKMLLFNVFFVGSFINHLKPPNWAPFAIGALDSSLVGALISERPGEGAENRRCAGGGDSPARRSQAQRSLAGGVNGWPWVSILP